MCVYVVHKQSKLKAVLFYLQELAERKANVYATLVKLQEEVSQITEITEILKDADNIKDSKTFVEEIKKEFGVCILN